MIISVTLFPVLLVSSPDHIGHLGDPSCLSEWRLKGAAVFATVLAVLTARRASETEKDVRLRIFKALAVHIATVKFTGRSSWSGAQVGNFVRTVMRDRYHMTYGAVLGEEKFKAYYTDFCKRGGKAATAAEKKRLKQALNRDDGASDGDKFAVPSLFGATTTQVDQLATKYQNDPSEKAKSVMAKVKKWREDRVAAGAASAGAETTRLKQALTKGDSSNIPIPSLFFATKDEVDRLKGKWEGVDSDRARAMLAAVKKWHKRRKTKPGQGKNGLAVRDDSSSSSFFFSTYEYRD